MDANRMRQLLTNLLGNAGQHGERGRPIKLFAAADEVKTTFRIVNEGQDIPQDLLGTIFEPLVRLSAEQDDPAHRTTSLGLGLHIAREIALSHGGTITAQSEGNLTTFTICVPARHAQAT